VITLTNDVVREGAPASTVTAQSLITWDFVRGIILGTGSTSSGLGMAASRGGSAEVEAMGCNARAALHERQ
jgi:hypothetical protein